MMIKGFHEISKKTGLEIRCSSNNFYEKTKSSHKSKIDWKNQKGKLKEGDEKTSVQAVQSFSKLCNVIN